MIFKVNPSFILLIVIYYFSTPTFCRSIQKSNATSQQKSILSKDVLDKHAVTNSKEDTKIVQKILNNLNEAFEDSDHHVWEKLVNESVKICKFLKEKCKFMQSWTNVKNACERLESLQNKNQTKPFLDTNFKDKTSSIIKQAKSLKTKKQPSSPETRKPKTTPAYVDNEPELNPDCVCLKEPNGNVRKIINSLVQVFENPNCSMREKLLVETIEICNSYEKKTNEKLQLSSVEKICNLLNLLQQKNFLEINKSSSPDVNPEIVIRVKKPKITSTTSTSPSLLPKTTSTTSKPKTEFLATTISTTPDDDAASDSSSYDYTDESKEDDYDDSYLNPESKTTGSRISSTLTSIGKVQKPKTSKPVIPKSQTSKTTSTPLLPKTTSTTSKPKFLATTISTTPDDDVGSDFPSYVHSTNVKKPKPDNLNLTAPKLINPKSTTNGSRISSNLTSVVKVQKSSKHVIPKSQTSKTTSPSLLPRRNSTTSKPESKFLSTTISTTPDDDVGSDFPSYVHSTNVKKPKPDNLNLTAPKLINPKSTTNGSKILSNFTPVGEVQKPTTSKPVIFESQTSKTTSTSPSLLPKTTSTTSKPKTEFLATTISTTPDDDVGSDFPSYVHSTNVKKPKPDNLNLTAPKLINPKSTTNGSRISSNLTSVVKVQKSSKHVIPKSQTSKTTSSSLLPRTTSTTSKPESKFLSTTISTTPDDDSAPNYSDHYYNDESKEDDYDDSYLNPESTSTGSRISSTLTSIGKVQKPKTSKPVIPKSQTSKTTSTPLLPKTTSTTSKPKTEFLATTISTTPDDDAASDSSSYDYTDESKEDVYDDSYLNPESKTTGSRISSTLISIGKVQKPTTSKPVIPKSQTSKTTSTSLLPKTTSTTSKPKTEFLATTISTTPDDDVGSDFPSYVHSTNVKKPKPDNLNLTAPKLINPESTTNGSKILSNFTPVGEVQKPTTSKPVISESQTSKTTSTSPSLLPKTTSTTSKPKFLATTISTTPDDDVGSDFPSYVHSTNVKKPKPDNLNLTAPKLINPKSTTNGSRISSNLTSVVKVQKSSKHVIPKSQTSKTTSPSLLPRTTSTTSKPESKFLSTTISTTPDDDSASNYSDHYSNDESKEDDYDDAYSSPELPTIDSKISSSSTSVFKVPGPVIPRTQTYETTSTSPSAGLADFNNENNKAKVDERPKVLGDPPRKIASDSHKTTITTFESIPMTEISRKGECNCNFGKESKRQLAIHCSKCRCRKKYDDSSEYSSADESYSDYDSTSYDDFFYEDGCLNDDEIPNNVVHLKPYAYFYN